MTTSASSDIAQGAQYAETASAAYRSALQVIETIEPRLGPA
ncbi:Probable serine or glycine hydroxymethyltransferase [Mycobacteroides abscessus]|nr:Probable serine or glycine hydroxymethyltransferase [Mycobacteroides abscessus]